MQGIMHRWMAPRACDGCAVRKTRCDGQRPCTQCLKAGFDCTFVKVHKRPGPKGPRKATRERLLRTIGRSAESVQRSVTESQSTRDAGQSIASPTGAPMGPAQPSSGRLPLSAICSCLEIYRDRLYLIWPAVDSQALASRLAKKSFDPETYSLATSLCAATLSQLRLDAVPVNSSRFEAEALRARSTYDYRERANLSSVLTSFFLHIYYANMGSRKTSTILLREAITFADLMSLHTAGLVETADVAEREHYLRVYWLLFITERGHAIQNDIPATMAKISQLPSASSSDEQDHWTAFTRLIQLFLQTDKPLIESLVQGDSSAVPYSQNQIGAMQDRLRNLGSYPTNATKTQRADILVTQHWMRTLLWQLSISHFVMNITDRDEAFSLMHPASIGRDLLATLSSMPREAFEVHGPGMEVKIFDIANALLNVNLCLSSVSSSLTVRQYPKNIMIELSRVISSMTLTKSSPLRTLQQRMSEIDVFIESHPPLLLNLDERDPLQSPEDSSQLSDTSKN